MISTAFSLFIQLDDPITQLIHGARRIFPAVHGTRMASSGTRDSGRGSRGNGEAMSKIKIKIKIKSTSTGYLGLIRNPDREPVTRESSRGPSLGTTGPRDDPLDEPIPDADIAVE
jgi:hypothetical protein